MVAVNSFLTSCLMEFFWRKPWLKGVANEMHVKVSLRKNIVMDLRVLARKLAGLFGKPTQVSTQVQLVST